MTTWAEVSPVTTAWAKPTMPTTAYAEPAAVASVWTDPYAGIPSIENAGFEELFTADPAVGHWSGSDDAAAAVLWYPTGGRTAPGCAGIRFATGEGPVTLTQTLGVLAQGMSKGVEFWLKKHTTNHPGAMHIAAIASGVEIGSLDIDFMDIPANWEERNFLITGDGTAVTLTMTAEADGYTGWIAALLDDFAVVGQPWDAPAAITTAWSEP
jgi:hypothetical protein